MDGLRIDIDSGFKFPNVLAPAIRQLTSHFWLIETQSGPFNITDKPNFIELQAEIEDYRVKIPRLEGTSVSLWRPGIFPLYEGLFLVDEMTSLIALRAPENVAINVAEILVQCRHLSERVFEVVEAETAAFFLHVDGWWEVYSSDQQLLDRLRARKAASEIQSNRWFTAGAGE